MPHVPGSSADAVEALAELVRLKNLKDQIEAGIAPAGAAQAYAQGKPLAWARARAAVTAAKPVESLEVREFTRLEPDLQDRVSEILAELVRADPATGLTVAAGVFVSLLVSYMAARGLETDRSIHVDGGNNRDITVHPPKKGLPAS